MSKAKHKSMTAIYGVLETLSIFTLTRIDVRLQIEYWQAVSKRAHEVESTIGQYCGAVYAGGLAWYSIMSLPEDQGDEQEE